MNGGAACIHWMLIIRLKWQVDMNIFVTMLTTEQLGAEVYLNWIMVGYIGPTAMI